MARKQLEAPHLRELRDYENKTRKHYETEVKWLIIQVPLLKN